MPQAERNAQRTRNNNRRRTRSARTIVHAPSKRSPSKVAMPSFGPRPKSRALVVVRVGPPLLALASTGVAASGVAGAAGTAVLGVLAALAVAHVIANSIAGSEGFILRSLGGRVAEANRDARLLNIVDGLCAAFGLAEPKVIVVVSADANAVAFGKRHRRALLVVTSAALEGLQRIELEALVAHELAHLRREDTVQAAAAMRALGYLARRNASVAQLCASLSGGDRESYADLAATSITRYPPALADTLELLAENRGALVAELPRDLVRLTGWQWCAPLTEQGALPWATNRLSLYERAQALREL